MGRVHRCSGQGALVTGVLCATILLAFLLPSTLAASPPTLGRDSEPTGRAGSLLASYPVNFTELGLPPGSTWTVTLGTASESSTGPAIVFYVTNGTYSYSVGSFGGYVPAQATGSLTVHGGNDTVIATLIVSGTKPWGGAADPLTGDVFMSYQQNGNLSIINGSTNQNGGNIPVGKNPVTPVYDPITHDFYVPNQGSNNLTVVDPTTRVRLANLTLGNQPTDGAFDAANGMIYVTNSGGNSVSVLNGSNDTVVATISVGTNPRGVAYDPLDHDIYVTNQGSDSVSVISGTPGSVVLTIPLLATSGPFGIVYDPANGELYVTQRGGAACTGGGGPCYGTLLNASTNGYNGTFEEGLMAAYPSFDPVNNLVYVPNTQNPGKITVVSSANHAPIGQILVGANPETVAADPENGLLYSANLGANTISVVNGAFYNESVAFIPRPSSLYPVNFTESGLPAGTNWSVLVNGTLYGASGATISVSEKNGTYPFAVENVPGFRASPSSGTLDVNGTYVVIPVAFASIPPPTYPITFVATGLPTGTMWGVTLNGVLSNSTGSSITFDQSNGTYAYAVASVRGYIESPSSGWVVVNGTGVTVTLGYSAVPPTMYLVTFFESGLPSGTPWSVTLGSGAQGGSTSRLAVNETDGTYAYTIDPVAGFFATPSSGVVTVNGSGQTVHVRFNSTTTGGGGGGSPPGGVISELLGADRFWLGALLVAVAMVVVIALVALARRRRRSWKGTSMAGIAAAAGLPHPISETSDPPRTPPLSESDAPPPSPPAPAPVRSERAVRKPEWSED